LVPYVCGSERDDGYRSISGGVVIQRHGRAPVLRAAGVLACIRVGRVVFSKSTSIALLRALADGDALENLRPLEEPDRYFRVIVRNGEIYKNALPGENPVRARQSYRQRERVDPKGSV
jgi:hypothetical protein